MKGNLKNNFLSVNNFGNNKYNYQIPSLIENNLFYNNFNYSHNIYNNNINNNIYYVTKQRIRTSFPLLYGKKHKKTNYNHNNNNEKQISLKFFVKPQPPSSPSSPPPPPSPPSSNPTQISPIKNDSPENSQNFTHLSPNIERYVKEELPAGLYIISTPIGNIGDISNRAKLILLSVKIIFCENIYSAKFLFSQLRLPIDDVIFYPYTNHSHSSAKNSIFGEGKEEIDLRILDHSSDLSPKDQFVFFVF